MRVKDLRRGELFVFKGEDPARPYSVEFLYVPKRHVSPSQVYVQYASRIHLAHRDCLEGEDLEREVRLISPIEVDFPVRACVQLWDEVVGKVRAE